MHKKNRLLVDNDCPGWEKLFVDIGVLVGVGLASACLTLITLCAGGLI